jgi:hypothetical protein
MTVEALEGSNARPYVEPQLWKAASDGPSAPRHAYGTNVLARDVRAAKPEGPSGEDPAERGASSFACVGRLEHVAVPRKDAHEVPGQHPLDAGLQGAPILGQPPP